MNILQFSKEIFKLYPLPVLVASCGLFASSLLEVFGIAALLPAMAGLMSGETTLEGGIIGRAFGVLGLSSLPVHYFLIAVVTFMFLRGVTLFLSNYIMLRLGYATTKTLRRKLVKAMLDAKWEFSLGQKAGRVVNIVSHQAYISGNAIQSMAAFYIPFVLSIVFFLISILVSFYSFVIAILLAIPLLGLSHYISKKTQLVSKKFVDIEAECGAEMAETINQTKYIKSCAMDEMILARFGSVTSKIVALGAENALLSSIIRVVPELLAVIVLSVLIAFMYNFQQGQAWDFVFFLMIMLRAYQYLSRAQSSRQILESQIPSYGMCLDFINEAEDKKERRLEGAEECKFTKNISINDIYFSYPSGKQVLHGITLNIPKNSLVAFVGKSGAGKTTIVDMIIGLLLPDKGSISVDEKNLKEISLKQWRSKISYVPQDIALSNDTVRNNIMCGLDGVTEEDMHEAVRKAHAEQFINDMQDGYDTFVGDRGMQLSGGQKQRIALARALIRKPEILILDEATSALDNEAERHIYNAISELRNDITIILIAHRLSTVRNCNKIFVIDDGRLVEEGTFEELYDMGGVFYDIYQGR